MHVSENGEEAIRFCPGCPLIPKGIVADLVSARPVTMGELLQFRFAHAAPSLAKKLAQDIHIQAKVVSSDQPDIAAGKTADMNVIVDTDADGVQSLIRDCHKPRKHWLRRQVCGALGRQ